MATLEIFGVEFCNTTELDSEIRAVFGNDLQLVTYAPINQQVTVQLVPTTITPDQERTIRNLVNDHISRLAQVAADELVIRQANETAANTQYLLSQLAGKTPAQISTYFDNQIDSLAWATVPTAVRNDLKNWFTVLAIIASKFQNREV